MRNFKGLNELQIKKCKMCWEFLTIGEADNDLFDLEGNSLNISQIIFDTSKAHIDGTKTRFNENRKTIILGADAFPGSEDDPNSRMSYQACLAHELAHAIRYLLGYRRPLDGNDSNIDESETSLHASFTPFLHSSDRIDLIGDAKLRILEWENNK